MSAIQPVFWGQLIIMLSADKRLTISQAHKGLEALGGVQVDEHTPQAIHTLLGKLEDTESYAFIPSLLSALSGVSEEALCKAANLLQGHLTSPDDIPDRMMRQMFRSVHTLLEEVSATGLMARAVADLMDALIREGRFPRDQIEPLVGFHIPHPLFRAFKRLNDEPDNTYRAIYLSLAHNRDPHRLHEIMFDVSYMIHVPANTLERCVDNLMTRLEGRKPYLDSDILAMIKKTAA